MKKTIIALLLLISACSFGQTKTVSKADTIKTVLFYPDPVSQELKLEFGFRLIRDTSKFVRTDAETFKKKRVIDTSYFVPVLVAQLDENKKPKVDTLGNPLMEVRYTYIPPSAILIDGNKNVDELIKKYYASKPKDSIKPK